jgi:hypothetical protein
LYGLVSAAYEVKNLIESSTIDVVNNTVSFFCDSKSALKICSAAFPLHPLAAEFQKIVHSFRVEQIRLIWAPARNGIPYQISADGLARSARFLTDSTDTVFLKRYTKAMCSRFESSNLQHLQSTIHHNVGSVPSVFFPNLQSFRVVNDFARKFSLSHEIGTILSGHNILGKFATTLGFQHDSLCQCGLEVEDTAHFLFRCSLHAVARSQTSIFFNRSFPTSFSDFTQSFIGLRMLLMFVSKSQRFLSH